MVTENTNPFVLPGFGQSGDMASNPMLASMEMMRKAWEGLAGTGGFDKPLGIPGTSPEDLERRISDLRAVENWLRMNLSMLSSTIQALEVQRSTFATLQAFMTSAGGGAGTAPTAPSPLDVALGIRRGTDASPSADSSGLFGDTAAPTSARSGQAAATDAGSPSAATAAGDGAGTGKPDDAAKPASGAADTVMQSWWDMLQTQFDNLASATAATLQGAEAVQDVAAAAQQQAVETTRAAAETLKKSTATSASAARKTPAAKTAPKKAATKKTTAKKAAAKKTAVKKTAARKTAKTATTASATKAAVKKVAAKKSPAKKSAAKKTAASGTGTARKS